MRSLELAVKYLAGERLIGTAAERAAMTTGSAKVIEPSTYGSASGWNESSGTDITLDTSNQGASYTSVSTNAGLGRGFTALSNTAWFCTFEFRFSGQSSNDMGYVTMTNDYTTTWKGSGKYTITCQAQSAGYWRFVLIKNTNGSYSELTGGTFAINTTYYCNFWRDGSNFYFKVYPTASDRTNNTNATVTLTESAPSGFDGQLDGLQHWSTGGSATGWVRNLTLWDGVTSAGASGDLVLPNLTNGTIFEESDTGKHYMFDGTSAWNEVT